MNKVFVAKWSSIVLWGLLFAYVLYINYCTPRIYDDWSYYTSWDRIVTGAWKEIFSQNPRFFSTLLTRIFTLSPSILIDIVNSIGFIIYVWLILFISFGNRWRIYVLSIETPLLLWALSVWLMPSCGEVFFWSTGAASYMWQNIFCLWLLSAIRSSFSDNSRCGSMLFEKKLYLPILLLLVALVAFSNFNFGILVILVSLYCVVARKVNCPRYILIILGMGIILYVLMILAPGNEKRGMMIKEMWPESYMENIQDRIWNQTKWIFAKLTSIRMIILYIVVVFSLLVQRRKLDKEYTKVAICAVLLSLVSLGAFLISPVIPADRALMPSFIMIHVAAVSIIIPSFQFKLARFFIYPILVCSFLLSTKAVPLLWQQRVWWDCHGVKLFDYSNTYQDVVLAYYPAVHTTPFADRSYYVSIDPKSWENKDLSTNLGLKSVVQSALRCTYSSLANDIELQINDEENINLILRSSSDKKNVHIAIPDGKHNFKELIYSFACSDDKLNYHELIANGYTVLTFEVGCEHLIDVSNNSSFRKNKIPMIYYSCSDENAEESVYFVLKSHPAWH